MHHQYHTIKLYDLFQFRKEKPASGGLLRKTKTKNSILALKSATNPSQRASQQLLFPTGGVYLKKSEPILLTSSADGRAKIEPLFHPPHQKRKGRFQVF